MNHLGPNLKKGDVLLANHPAAGGSHLPDLTVITPVSYAKDIIINLQHQYVHVGDCSCLVCLSVCVRYHSSFVHVYVWYVQLSFMIVSG